jgi:hypothetical protein
MSFAKDRRRVLLAFVATTVSLTLLAQPAELEKRKPRGPYLGQAPPGTTPLLFAPGFVNTGMELGCTFTPDGKEFYFGRGQIDDILLTAEKKKGWAAPKRLPMNGASVDLNPHVTADGIKLFFSSNRPVPPSTQPGIGIWVMDRAGKGWGTPRYHGPGGSVTTTASGNLYLSDYTEPSAPRIAVQRFVGGQYGPPEPLGDGVNDPPSNSDPCIAWDESFLIFSSRRSSALGGEGDWDLYVSFREPDGTWSQAQHVTEISSTSWDWCPSLSPDGQYLFFSRAGSWGSEIWWVSTQILEPYRLARETSGP